MGLSDRLAYIVTTDPKQAVAGFGQIGQAAQRNVRTADAEVARLQKRLDALGRQSAATQKQIDRQLSLAAKAQGKGDPLGADVARIRAKNLGDQLGVLQAKSRDAQSGLERMRAPATTLSGRLRGVGVGGEAAAAGLALAGAAALKFGVDAAFSADRQATAGRSVDAVFRDSAAGVREFAEDADQNLGLTETAALSAAAGFGNLFTKAGTAPAEAAKLAKGLTSLTTVLAAAHPEAGNTEDALIAIQAALRGEFDPLEKFKVKINATLAEQKALEMGLASTTAGLSEQEKQLATLQLLFERTSIEQGLFARNSETLAFQQQQTNAALQDFKASIGAALANDVGGVAQAVATLAGAAEDLAGATPGAFMEALVKFAALGAGPIGSLLGIAEGFNEVTGAGSDTKDVLADVNALNVEGRAKSLAGADSLKEQADAQKKVTAATRDALSAAEALVDVDDRIAAAKKAVAEAADDEAEKAEKVTAARRDEKDAARGLVEAEERLAEVRRLAPRNEERAAIGLRDAIRSQTEAQEEYDKLLRRRGAADPRTLEAEDKLRLAILGVADARDALDEWRGTMPDGSRWIPTAVQDAISTRDKAIEAAAAAEKRTREALAINPYEAQQKAAKDLRDAEQDRLVAVATLQEKLPLVSKELWAGFDATNATREQLDLIVARITAALVKQKELNAVTPTPSQAFGTGPPQPGAGAGGVVQVTPDPGINPNTGIPFVIGASAPRVAAAPPPDAAPTTTIQAQYTGPITVVASDPAEMQRRLEARQRLNRLGGL